ncbi:MAG: terminase large subunit, partial [bacterium]
DKIYRDENLVILKTTHKDNKFLNQEDRDVLEQETDSYWYDVYTLGKWGVLGNVIFENWKAEDIPSDFVRTFDNYKNGLDFGFASDPVAFNRTHYDRTRKKIYIIEELHELGLTNPMIADELKPIVRDEVVVCDSAEPKSIQELKDNGIKAIPAIKGPDSVNFGIQWLQQQEIVISKKCQNTINEFQLYQWKKNKQGETLRQPTSKNDHHIDALRYSCEDEMPSLIRKKRFGTWGNR